MAVVCRDATVPYSFSSMGVGSGHILLLSRRRFLHSCRMWCVSCSASPQEHIGEGTTYSFVCRIDQITLLISHVTLKTSHITFRIYYDICHFSLCFLVSHFTNNFSHCTCVISPFSILMSHLTFVIYHVSCHISHVELLFLMTHFTCLISQLSC